LYYLDLINLITFFNKLFFITKYHQTRHEGHMSRTLLYSAVFQWTLKNLSSQYGKTISEVSDMLSHKWYLQS